MRLAIGILLLILLFGAGAVRADQVTLKNGDRVTGRIVKRDGAMLVLDSANFGRINMPWDQVDSLSSDVPLHFVIGNETVEGTIAPAQGQLQIRTLSGGTRNASLSDLSAIRNNAEQYAYDRLQDPGWFELWTGTGTLAWAGTAGNARTKTFAFGAAASRTTLRDRTAIHFNAVTASALLAGATTSTARAVRGGWDYQRDITDRWFGTLLNDYEYDRFQSLDFRFVLGAGAGYHVLKNADTRLDLLSGLNYNRENFSTPLTRNAAEFFWGNQFDKKLNNTVSLVQSYRMFNSLTDSPDFRVNFDLGAVTRIAQWLSWNVTVSDRYLRNPVPGRLSNDVIYSTGLGVIFGGGR